MTPLFAMIPLSAIIDNRLTLRMLKTFAGICSFRKSSDDFCIQAGRDEISVRCGLHPSIISTATTELENLGWLKKSGRGGRAMKTSYLITPPKTVADSETVLNSATVMGSETVTDSVSKTVTESVTPLYKKEVNLERRLSRPPAESNGFAEFWQQYPKKVAKSDALQAWRKLKPSGQLFTDLMAGLASHKVSDQWRKNGGEFIPHPASWLNKRRWEDEAQSAVVQNQLANPVFVGAV
jgi:hypothetical protein